MKSKLWQWSIMVCLGMLMLNRFVFAAEPLVIKYGLEPSYAPFEYRGPDGQLRGFDIDIGNAVCKKLNAKCVWVENAFDGLIPALQARKFNVINSDMTITEQRKKVVDFTVPIYRIPSRLIAKKGSQLLPTVASLKGRRIGVQQGTIEDLYARARWGTAGVIIVQYGNQEQVYQDLIAGRLDGALQNAQAAEQGFLVKPQGAGFQFVGMPVEDNQILGGGIAMAVNKNDRVLLNALNKAIIELKVDGTIDQLAKKYFNISVTAK